VNSRQLARDLGLGDSLSHNAVMSRTLSRLCQFGLAQWVDGDLAVRTMVAPVPERHLRRLSPELVRVHQWMVGRQMVQAQTRSFSPVPVSPGVEQSTGMSL
jgi:hypothetical protein